MINEKCLIESCPATKTYCRGLCPTHYDLINRLVKEKKRTWEEFEKVGMSKHPHIKFGWKMDLLNKMIKKKFK